MASDDDTRPPPQRVLGVDVGGDRDRSAWAMVTRRTEPGPRPPVFTIDALGTDPPFVMPGSAAQRRVIMNGLYSAPVYAPRGVSHDPYPELNAPMGRWQATALRDPAGPVSVHASWSNVTGYSGTGWTIEVGDGEVWSWDAWVPALVVLAGAEDRVVGKRQCPVCRGRGTFDEWTSVTISGAGQLDGRYDVTGPMTCERCDERGSVDVGLAELVFAAAQGWPWAREHGSVIADRLQSEGDPWGHWLAALLEPRQWGGWFSYPKRREHAGELADRLDQLAIAKQQHRSWSGMFGPVQARPAGGKSMALLFSPLARAIERHRAETGRSYFDARVEITGEDPRLTAVTRGDTTTLTFHDDEPHTVRTYPVDYRGQARGFREPDEIVSEAVFQRALDRLALHGEPDDDRPVTPPIGRNLERRLNRGRRGAGG
jgi:hypothetical protein